ncbi:heme peroxidase [Mycena vitilis]|nr:heme peroxidase [Mycena vitilis]
MHFSSVPLFVFLLLGVASGSPAEVKRKGGHGGGGEGGAEGGGAGGTTIPTVANVKNPVCAPWYAVRDAIMGGIYHGRCNDAARASVRLAFHDAGPFSLKRQAAKLSNGASDGSLLVYPEEVLRPENNGLQTIVGLLKPLPKKFGVSPGDVLHLAGVLGVLACPGGPMINTYVGRSAPKNHAPHGMLPSPDDPVPKLTARFADMGLSVRDLMALIGAHSTGKARHVQLVGPQQEPPAFDSTVDVWDVRFYSETANSVAAPGTLRLNSDMNFAHNATTTKEYSRYIGEQDDWGRDYAVAHEKMSLLGINKNILTDCTEILPPPSTSRR